MLFLALTTLNFSFGQLSFDRTRVIFDNGKSSSQSVVVQNTSLNSPYLAQAWIENDNGQKITEPLAALPILQRINPKQEKQIKISLIGNAAQLPSDRESLLYFNVLGVPPKDGANESQINVVIQSKLKLFYRPKGLPQYSNSGWVKEMNVRQSGNTLSLENPTPYHIVIYGFGSQKNGSITEKDVVIKPFGTESVSIKTSNTPYIYYINDYGAAGSLSYDCRAGSCALNQ